MKRLLLAALLAVTPRSAVHEHPGGKQLPHERYVRVVSETDSPMQKLYIKSKDGLYVAAALRKPKGDGPFPVLIHFHGAPGGRGMEKLVEWSSGSTGGPVWERFLQEGYVVVTADYRGVRDLARPLPEDQAATYIDDALAVVEHVRSLPYVDTARINACGVSLGGNVALRLSTKTKLHALVLGAPAPLEFLGATLPPGTNMKAADRYKHAVLAQPRASQKVAAIQCPVLILVGTADGLMYLDRLLYDEMQKAGKPVRMDVYANGYHDFVMGPQGHAGRAEPLLDATLEALELALRFVKEPKPE